jgi:ubiquinone/menaquinone biosynthesis C-methylase UbiE
MLRVRWLDALRVGFLRFAFYHFYNTFAWTYDAVSAGVSLGHWREWTRAAIPYLRGSRVLEIAFGTGNLQLDMRAAGIEPYGVDLSPNMVRLTRRKLRRAGFEPRLIRASVFQLPLAGQSVDSIVLTFPPAFLSSASAVGEMRRVLCSSGRIVVVDAGWLRRPRWLSRLINLAFRFTGTANFESQRTDPLRSAGFDVRIISGGDRQSSVQVLVADMPKA